MFLVSTKKSQEASVAGPKARRGRPEMTSGEGQRPEPVASPRQEGLWISFCIWQDIIRGARVWTDIHKFSFYQDPLFCENSLQEWIQGDKLDSEAEKNGKKWDHGNV